MKTRFFNRPTFPLLIIALWMSFASTPSAETTLLQLKVTGEIRAESNGVVSRLKVINSTLKQGIADEGKLVLQIGDSTNVVSVVSNVVTQVIINGITNDVPVSVTNTVTNVVVGALSIVLVDPHGVTISTFYDLSDVVASLDTIDSAQRLFALGQGCDQLGTECPTNTRFGPLLFDDAVLVGTIKYNSSNRPASMTGTLQSHGDSDQGTILITLKLVSSDRFVPAP